MDKIRVLHVDDSAVIRGIISRILEKDSDIELVGSAHNGEQGVAMYQDKKPDVTIMDIEMPVMNGLDALKAIIRDDRKAKVIMCSTLTVDNGEITMQAMKIGAIDYVAKPTNAGEAGSSKEFHDRLLFLVKNISGAIKSPVNNAKTSTPSIFKGDIKLRPLPPLHWKPSVIAVGSSTGGPQALFEFMKALQSIKTPVVITQHMPATFTTLLARHIKDQAGFDCVEAEQGMTLTAGQAILARGGKHMEFKKNAAGQVVVDISDSQPENFCKPAVDPMMRSLVSHFGGKIMSVILTGMGYDGLKGTEAVVAAGGYCLAQNAETSIVWGMPGAVATNGLCSAVLPLNEMAPWVKNHAR